MILDRFRRSDPKNDLLIGTVDGVPLSRIPSSTRVEIQYLATRLAVWDDELPRSIALTSQSSGEGVSFISQALAGVLARTRQTCLLEANWWSSGLPLPEPGPGLSALLNGAATIEQVTVSTNYPGLTIIPPGELPADGRSVLTNSEALVRALSDLEEHFDYVVLDLPALTASATALSFAAAVGGTILVARQRKAKTDQVEAALSDLAHTNFLGLVVNGNSIATPDFISRRLAESR